MKIIYLLPTRWIVFHLSVQIFLFPESNRLELHVPDFPKQGKEIRTLYDFSSTRHVDARKVNDDVMGGVSSGICRINDNALIFSGHLSTRNNGGFASCFLASPVHNLQEFRYFRLRLLGDGNRYGFSAISGRTPGITHRYYFNTENGKWIDLSIPFSEFIATRRWENLGKQVPFQPTDVRELGFIAYSGPGVFELKIASIAVVQLP
jgi:monofunctional biosynthetic peptidoglycan transglycosylase